MTTYTPPLQVLVKHLQGLITERDGGMIRPRIIITISGIPGSGKTSLAKVLTTLMNRDVEKEGPARNFKTIAIPMDGFHLPRAELDEEGLRRRGAPHTFNANALVALVRKLKTSIYTVLPDIKCPSFDHAVKDPVQDDITIPRSTNVIILEGNYLLLEDEPWCQIKDMVTESWFLMCGKEVATERLAKRHLQAGLVQTLDEGRERARINDMPNGHYLRTHALQPTGVIRQAHD